MTVRYRTAVIMLISTVAGCRETDPVLRSDLWHPTGVNEMNIAAMVASPQDLVRGEDEQNSDGVRAAAAVRRLETNRVKPLMDSGLSTVKLQGNGDSSGNDGGAVAGGTP